MNRRIPPLWRSALAVVYMLTAAGTARPSSLLPPIPGAWKAWTPRPALKAEADIVNEDGVPCLRLRSRGFPSYGKWMATADGIRPGVSYRFEILYRASGVTSEDTSVAVIASWISAENKAVQREYIDAITAEPDGWKRAARTLQAPEKARSVRLELALRWTERGSVLWKRATVAEAEAPSARRIRVVTTRIQPEPGATVEKNLALMAETLDRAAAQKPDLVLFTENLVDRSAMRPLEETSQTIPGPATDMLAERARRYKTWVATSLHEREGDLLYNTAVLIDREGRIAGKYRKVHLAMAEGENGITPGSDYPVFDTDFGKVGMLVCWDNWFGEAARAMRLKGAEILLLPIAGDSVPDNHWDIISRARAIDNAVYLVAASTYAMSPSRIIDPNGIVLAEASAGIAAADIELTKRTRVYWLSVGSANGDPKSLYIKERRPDTYGGLAEKPRQ